VVPLRSGQNYSTEIPGNTWAYFSIGNTVPGGVIRVATAPVQIFGQSGFQDADLYIKFGSLPTINFYDKRDISYGADGYIIVDNAFQGQYYIGVFGQPYTRRVAFSIVARIDGLCPSGCINGNCVNGVCHCREGWSGDDCSIAVTHVGLLFDRLYIDSVAYDTWKYFFTDLQTSMTEFFVIVNITSQPPSQHVCDVFVRYDEVPDDFHWDHYESSEIGPNFVITVPNATKGRWYIAFWGNKQCDFKLQLKSGTQRCLSKCSGHGICTSSGCRCIPQYNGTYCESKLLPLQNNELVSGYVEQNVWNYYEFDTDTQDNIVVILNQTNSTNSGGNCDLYAKYGGRPTKFNYDFVEVGTNLSYELLITEPLKERLFIGVSGFKDCNYLLKVIKTQGCTDQCKLHGTCVNGVCKCNPGYSGENCDSSFRIITSGQELHSVMTRPGEWQYYNFTVTTFTAVVALKEHNQGKGTEGFLNLYLSEGLPPTLTNFAIKEIGRSFYHNIAAAINLQRQPPFNLYLGVNAGPYFQEHVPYSITAWCPDF